MANESNATNEAATDAEADVHRLRDILVEEVSLVDRAANKRRFLVVKRSNDMSNDGKRGGPRKAEDETTSAAARGRSKKKPKSDPKVDKARRRAAPTAADQDEDDEDDDDDDEMEKAGSRRPPWEDEDDEDEDNEEDKDDDEEDEDTEKADDEADEDEDEDTEKADEDDEDEDDDEAGNAGPGARAARGRPAASNGRRATRAEKAGDDLVMAPAVKTAALRVLAKALERLMGVANRIKKAEEPDDKTEASVPGHITGELEDIGQLLEDVAGRLPAAKAGRRMAKDRLDRFQKALALLSDVLKELTHAQQVAEPAGAGTENKAQKRITAPSMGTLVASVTELAQILKGQQEDLARLRNTRATSNAIAVDGGRPRVSQDVSWPLDMNRPISRDGLSKAVSFFDD